MVSDTYIKLKEALESEELDGVLGSQNEEDKLMHSVLENDKKTIDEGRLIKDALNMGLSSFTPDLMFEQLVKNYSMAKKIFGASIIRNMTGYDARYVEKNIKIPEFQRDIKKKIESNIDALKDKGLIGKGGFISDVGFKLASLILYTEELDKLVPKGIFGEKIHKKTFVYGDKEDIKEYRKGDKYRDLAIKKSARITIRRGKAEITKEDLRTYERQSKGQIYLVYGLDASGSMKGKKIEICKKAGIALAFKATEEKDKVGLLVFGSDIKESVHPTLDFRYLLDKITRINASKETDLAKTIHKSIELFPRKKVTKHLILITDAMPTVGTDPKKNTLEACSLARSVGITISLIGIQLDKEGVELAKKIVELGGGRFYVVKDLEEVDKIVLEDYYSVI